jgi:hypothetical protein
VLALSWATLEKGAPLGQVQCIAIEGLDLWFNSHDHVPPHFHVGRRGEYELRIFFLECTADELAFNVKWGGEPDARVLADIRELVVKNRVPLLEEWERKVCPE